MEICVERRLFIIIMHNKTFVCFSKAAYVSVDEGYGAKKEYFTINKKC